MKDLTLDLPVCPAGDVTVSAFASGCDVTVSALASCCRCKALIRQSYNLCVYECSLVLCRITVHEKLKYLTQQCQQCSIISHSQVILWDCHGEP